MGRNEPVEEVFADTCVLLSFVQREWERNRSQELVESETVDVVVSQNVIDEFDNVSARRRDIYEDLVDFLLEQDDLIEEYDPGERRVYVGENDAKHVFNLQMELSSLDDRQEVLRRLRQFVRAAGRRTEYVKEELEEDAIDPLPPISLVFAMDRALNQSADTRVVTDAAAWSADGGSGVLVTLDDDDILAHEDDIRAILFEEQGDDWLLTIVPPGAILSSERLAEQTD